MFKEYDVYIRDGILVIDVIEWEPESDVGYKTTYTQSQLSPF